MQNSIICPGGDSRMGVCVCVCVCVCIIQNCNVPNQFYISSKSVLYILHDLIFNQFVSVCVCVCVSECVCYHETSHAVSQNIETSVPT